MTNYSPKISIGLPAHKHFSLVHFFDGKLRWRLYFVLVVEIHLDKVAHFHLSHIIHNIPEKNVVKESQL